jgi:cytochrome c oxidase subunit II
MSLLTYIILILAAAAIWQLVRVVELSAKLKGVDPNEITERDNRMNGRFMMAFYILFMAFCIWQYLEYDDKMLPVAASEHGPKIDWLLNFNFIVCIVVFFITNFMLFYMGYKYYGRDGQRAAYYPHNNKLEMLWTGVPAVVLFVIIFLGIRLWNDVMGPAPKNTRIIEIYGQQFNWTVRYSGEDNELGKANYLFIGGTNQLGLDSTDLRGHDDVIVTDTIFLPVGEEVDIRMRSRDVIHSMYMPHFRAQMNVVPGMETYFHFKPTIKTVDMRKVPEVIHQIDEINRIRDARGDEPFQFDYLLLCNKVCGASHYNMQIKIVVGTRKEYDDFMKRHKPYFFKEPAKTAQVTAN